MNTFSLSAVFSAVKAHSIQFLAVFFIVFTVSYGILVLFDFVPEPISEFEETTPIELIDEASAAFDPMTAVSDPKPAPAAPIVTEEPVRLSIPALDRSVNVVPAASNAVTDLDQALLSGVVRHPDSALLGETGNVVILGHSSYLPNVLNRNFQALNGTQNLEWGDSIIVESETTRYTYIVRKVYKVKASEYVISTTGEGKRLTLVTCNSFATADDRFIIESELLTSEPL